MFMNRFLADRSWVAKSLAALLAGFVLAAAPALAQDPAASAPAATETAAPAPAPYQSSFAPAPAPAASAPVNTGSYLANLGGGSVSQSYSGMASSFSRATTGHQMAGATSGYLNNV